MTISAVTNWHVSRHQRSILEAQGWLSFHLDIRNSQEFQRILLDIGMSLGTPVPGRGRNLVETLLPLNKADAEPRSLSKMIGTGRQPWHSDMAHRIEPAKFLIMGMCNASVHSASTELLEASKFIPAELSEDASSEPFLVRTGAKSFYATIISKSLPFIRFDPGCLEGATIRGKILMNSLGTRNLAATYRHEWSSGSVLIIDNWKMLHRRTSAAKSTDRILYRVSVMRGQA